MMIFHSFIIGIHGLTLYVKIFHSHRTVCLFTVFVGGSKPNTELILLSCLLVQLSVCLFVCLFMLMILSRQINQLLISRMRWPQAVPLWIGPFLWFSSLTIKKERISLSIGKMVCFHAFNTTTIVRWGQQQTGRWSMIESNWDIVCWNVSIGSVVIIDCIWPLFCYTGRLPKDVCESKSEHCECVILNNKTLSFAVHFVIVSNF